MYTNGVPSFGIFSPSEGSSVYIYVCVYVCVRKKKYIYIRWNKCRRKPSSFDAPFLTARNSLTSHRVCLFSNHVVSINLFSYRLCCCTRDFSNYMCASRALVEIIIKAHRQLFIIILRVWIRYRDRATRFSRSHWDYKFGGVLEEMRFVSIRS